MVELIVWIILHLLALVLMSLSALGVGCLFLGRVSFHSLLERVLFTIAAGLGAFGLMLFLLGLAGALYREAVLALTAAGGLSGLTFLVRQREQIKSSLQSLRPAKAALILFGLSCWAFVLWPTFFPPNEWDATSNHLFLAREYLSTHRITAPPGIPHPVLPALNHMLFTWAMAIEDDIAAQMIEHMLMMIVAAGIYSLGQRRNRPLWGVAAGLFWLANPLVLWLGQAAYIDMGVTAFAFLAVAALGNFFESRESIWWLIAMSLAGMAAGAKMTGLFFVAAIGIAGLWAWAKSRIRWKELIAGSALAFLIAAPFYALIAYHTGNPLWPVLAHLSQGVWADPTITQFNNWINRVGVAKTPLNFLLLPFYLSFELERFLPEPRICRLIIFWPLAWIISFRDRETRWWTLWALAFTAFWFLTSQQTRLLLPALPFMILALYESVGYITERLFKSAALRRAIWAGAAACALILIVRAVPGVIVSSDRPPTDPAARENFLMKFYSGYGGVRYINSRSLKDETVYVIGGSWLNYYFTSPIIDWNGLVQRMHRPSFRWPEDTDWVESLKSGGVRWILVFYHGNPAWMKMHADDPAWRPRWPPYEIVYEDAQAWVFRHP